MKAYVLGAQMLAALGDPEVVIDGGEGVGDLRVRFAGMMIDGRFSICVAVPEAPITATATSGRKWTRGPKTWTRDEDDLAVLHEGAMCPPYLEAVDATYPPGPGCAEAIAMAAARGAQFSKGWGEPAKPLKATWPKTIRKPADDHPYTGPFSETLRTPVSTPPTPILKVVVPQSDGPTLEFVHPDEHERVVRELGAAQRLNEANAHSLKTVRGWYDNAKRELLDYQTWARGLVGMNLPDDSEADIRGMLSDRLMDGVSHDEHERVKAAKRELDEALSKWHDLACDIGDVDGDQHGDAGLRLAVVAAYEEMARDAAKAMRLERERDKARGLHKTAVRFGGEVAESFKAASGRLDAWRRRVVGLAGLAGPPVGFNADADLWRRLLHALARDSTAPVRALLALAVDGEPAHSLERLFDRLDDVLAEAREAIEHGDKVHAAGVEEGRRLEREKAAELWVKGEPEASGRIGIRRRGSPQMGYAECRRGEWWVSWGGGSWFRVGGWGDNWERRVFPETKHLSVDP